MTVSHAPVDLDALQDAIAHQPFVAHAIETETNSSGHAAPGSQRQGAEVAAEPLASPPVPHLGVEAAANMTKLAKAAAEGHSPT
jgi:hypothetical protein